MKSEAEDEHSTHEIRTRPNTPRRRPPLPRMMENHSSNTRNYESKKNETSCEPEEDNMSSCESDELDDDRTELKESYSHDSKCDSKISKATRRKAASVSCTTEPKISPTLPQTIPSSKKKSNEIKTAQYPRISNKSCSQDHVNSKQNINSKWSIIFWVCTVIIGLSSVLFIVDPSNAFRVIQNIVEVEKSSTFKDAIRDFEANIDEISYKFKNQHSEIWEEIFAGVVNVKKHPEKRSIIFLFSNNEDPMSCLARMIGNATKGILNTDILYLSSSNLGNDYGSVIYKFEKQIKQHRVVIVDNLLDIDVQALRAFHNLCDSENPLVRQTIYILTMIANGYKNNERPIDFVTKQLERKLKGKIQSDKLQPLITRITDAAIYPVQPEPDFTSCPLRY
ncbi:hypothetical protein PV326_010628 [Microctonus aethiopoides]|nr:hypothetical protein PV326_010628 [Microctonus aethiopoides]